jgi:hypothetical protein
LVKKREEKPREITKRQLSSHKRQELRQKIILITGTSIIAAIVLLVGFGWFFGEYYPLNKTIVTVYDTKIKQSMLIDTLVYFGQGYSGLDLASQIDYVLKYIVQNELNKKAASAMDILVSDAEIVEEYGKGLNEAQKASAYATLLTQKMKDQYFSTVVPDSGNQVLMNAMLVESDEIIPQLRAELLSSGNFSALADKYAGNYVSKNNKGVFDWHPADILISDIGTAIPVDWAFSENVSAGDISSGVSDNTSSKQLGYWLIRVNERPENFSTNASANISALLVSSQAEAERVKALLEATDDISAIADQYSQYSPSQQGHGELGIIEASENISTPFNDYAFDPDAVPGEWSTPIQDTKYWTKGGSWFIQVVDKENGRPYSEEDMEQKLNTAFSEWSEGLWADATENIIYTFDQEERDFAIKRATEKLTK